MERILRGNSETLRLLPPLPHPFDSSHPPKFIRARLFVYDFAPWTLDFLNVFRRQDANVHSATKEEAQMWVTGSVWKRRFVREYVPSISLENESLRMFLKQLNLQHNDELKHESGKQTQKLFISAYLSAGLFVNILVIAESICKTMTARLLPRFAKEKTD